MDINITSAIKNNGHPILRRVPQKKRNPQLHSCLPPLPFVAMASNTRPTKKIRLETARIIDVADSLEEDPISQTPIDRDREYLIAGDAKILELENQLAQARREREEIHRRIEERIDEHRRPVLCNDRLLAHILSFLPNTFRFSAAVDKQFQAVYAAIHDDSKTTTLENAIQTVDTVRIYLADGADAAAVASLATRGGKLDVLKAIHSEGHEITGRNLCDKAAERGYLKSCNGSDPLVAFGIVILALQQH